MNQQRADICPACAKQATDIVVLEQSQVCVDQQGDKYIRETWECKACATFWEWITDY